LADPDLALKLQEKQPTDLDSALRLALQLEDWAADTARLREATQSQTEPKRIREITKTKTKAMVEALQKEVEEQRRNFAELENKVFRSNNGGFQLREANRLNRFNQPQGSGICWRCGSTSHRICDCPVAATDERAPVTEARRGEARRSPPKEVRPIKETKKVKTCITVKYRKYRISALTQAVMCQLQANMSPEDSAGESWSTKQGQ